MAIPEFSKLVPEGFFGDILEKHKDTLVKQIGHISKGIWEKFKIGSDIAFWKYTKNSYEKYSKIKTILYRTEPRYIYDFFEPPTLIKGTRYTKREGIATDDVDKILDISHFIIIQGTGGIGKSTLLKHFFINELEKKDVIPVFLELRDINDNENDSLSDILFKKLENLGSSIQKEYIDYALESGCFLFLLDGYDEISTDKRDIFLKELDSFCDQYNKNYYIISSRPYGESNFIDFQRFTVLETVKFSKEQAVSLVRKLDYDEAIKERFMKELKETLYDKHRSFASNPLLLTMMLLTFDNYAEIPEKLHVFYANAFETLYRKHDATKTGYKREMHCTISSNAFEKVFSCFSFFTYRRKSLRFTYHDLEEALQWSSKRSKTQFNISDYIKDLTDSICLLYQEGLNEYSYVHRSFQEYFTAVFLRDLPDHLMQKIGLEMIKQDIERSYTDSVFMMLYDMAEDRYEQNILLPLLEEYEKEYDNKIISIGKYNFYIKKMLDGAMICITEDGLINILGSLNGSFTHFMFGNTSHYMVRYDKYSNAKKEATQKLLDYLTENKGYYMEAEIPFRLFWEDETAYNLLKETVMGEVFKVISELVPELMKRKEEMQDNLLNLLEDSDDE